ncbi:MAG: hypothetical protein KBA60_03705 [Flavobacteriales bacterium]|nr:hypothetical protein [Flavobacteriales bacterium]MBP6641799.1 hypothetical protein [Flavobacteriales bacterium]MBP7155088.1 hypothetical protein [Flavobacteriales bacterium]HQV74583.1 hypothetical protein [Flavobacteriales bacterium]HQW40343.1 hypothetical protein [Flavobacteriales bacterium]
MQRPIATSKLIIATFLFAVFTISCSKENVSPCGQHSNEVNDGDAAASKSRPSGGSTDGQGAISISTTNPTTSKGDNGISDDGDDLSDSERSRKKLRN